LNRQLFPISALRKKLQMAVPLRSDAKDLQVLRLPGIAFGKPLSAQNIARHWLWNERASKQKISSGNSRPLVPICSYGV
jgi:hypothetical protein